MDFDTLSTTSKTRLRVRISRKDSSEETLTDNVLRGLTQMPKKLSSKFFYDAIGSNLFEQICELPEYYLTRSETQILEEKANKIADQASNCTEMVELGSGSSTKTQLLISAFLKQNKKLHYIPVDISKQMVIKSAKRLLATFSKLRITTLVSDNATALKALKARTSKDKIILFLGSSIGNFEAAQAEAFLRLIREAMNPSDKFLIGMDLVKSADILIPAYDDSKGITTQFNLNLLSRINRELDGEFDVKNFTHKTVYNGEKKRIESYLVSQKKQSVFIGKLERHICFEAGESIHTENSHKYSKADITQMAERNGFKIKQSWYDKNDWFSLNLMVPV